MQLRNRHLDNFSPTHSQLHPHSLPRSTHAHAAPPPSNTTSSNTTTPTTHAPPQGVWATPLTAFPHPPQPPTQSTTSHSTSSSKTRQSPLRHSSHPNLSPPLHHHQQPSHCLHHLLNLNPHPFTPQTSPPSPPSTSARQASQMHAPVSAILKNMHSMG